MSPCPLCGCTYHKLAFHIERDASTVAVACMRCEHVGPFVILTYPPGRVSWDLAADAWNTSCQKAAYPRMRLVALH